MSHLLFWTVNVFFYGTLYGSNSGEYQRELFAEVFYLPAQMLLTYFTLYYLLPKYLLKKRWVVFVLTFLVSAFMFGFLQRVITYYVEYPIFYPGNQETSALLMPMKMLNSVVSIYPVVFSALAIKLLKYWYVNQQDQQALAKEKLEAELKFLKTQIHPHFLFNTLNNLYALTLKKSDKAPEMVIKISELINYMLYECNVDEVSVEKEISHAKNYIEIEKMRHDSNLDVTLSVQGDVKNVSIAPLIILPFLENSFKHGVSEELEKSWIQFDVSITKEGADHTFILRIKNSKSSSQRLLNNGSEKGIGLANVRKRLDLLYGDNFMLNTTDENDTYSVDLTIFLNK